MIAAAADTGESSAWAVVETLPRGRPRLLALHEVFGAEHLWWPRAMAGAAAIVAAHGAVHCCVEVPPPVVRAGRMAHHATGHGLGMRAGLLRAAWWQASGELAGTQEPAEWWAAWRTLGLVLKGKTRWEHGKPPPGWVDGYERVGQAEMYVEGARERLAQVGSRARQVDLAESVLQAGACAMLSEKVDKRTRER